MRRFLMAAAVSVLLVQPALVKAQGWLPRGGTTNDTTSSKLVRIDGREYRVGVSLTTRPSFISFNILTPVPVGPPITSVDVSLTPLDGKGVAASVVPIRATVHGAFRPLLRTTLSTGSSMGILWHIPTPNNYRGSGPLISSLTNVVVVVEVRTRTGVKAVDVPVQPPAQRTPITFPVLRPSLTV